MMYKNKNTSDEYLQWTAPDESFKPVPLYTSDQLREAQVKALREAAEYFKSVTWHNVDAKLQRLADTIEKEMK